MGARTLKFPIAIALLCVGLQAQDLTIRLDSVLAKYNDKNGPGMAAMLIRDGRIVYRKEFGYADLDAHTLIARDTQFALGSTTKQFTAMAIMILNGRGKLQFEDPLAKFCP